MILQWVSCKRSSGFCVIDANTFAVWRTENRWAVCADRSSSSLTMLMSQQAWPASTRKPARFETWDGRGAYASERAKRARRCAAAARSLLRARLLAPLSAARRTQSDDRLGRGRGTKAHGSPLAIVATGLRAASSRSPLQQPGEHVTPARGRGREPLPTIDHVRWPQSQRARSDTRDKGSISIERNL